MSSCSLHILDLYDCIRNVISEFNSEIEGLHASCVLMLFLHSILCIMCSGSSLHMECILRLGCCVCMRGECCV